MEEVFFMVSVFFDLLGVVLFFVVLLCASSLCPVLLIFLQAFRETKELNCALVYVEALGY